jgi:fructose-bisphosphate aldolase class II
LATTRDLIGDAHRRGGAVAAFNVITLEHAEGIVRGAAGADRPVILQVSENAVAYHDGELGPLAAALRVIAARATVPVALHLDHVENEVLLRQGTEAGFSSIMVDAGRLPYAENVRQTASETDRLHARGVFVEAELGYVGGKDSQPASAHAPGVRTDPDQAREFVMETGVDALAVAVGSSHAMTSRGAALDFDLIARLSERVPVPLVLHGSSGVADDDLRRAVAAGMTKINIGTALNLAFTGTLREALGASESADPRPFLRQAREAVAETVRNLIAVVSG